MPPNWHGLDEDGIIDPAYNMDLHGIPRPVAQAMERRDASVVPVAKRMPAFNGDDGDGAMGGGP